MIEGLPTSKELKKIAAACRKAGIKSLKIGAIELTFADAPPVTPRRAKAVKEATLGAPLPASTDPDVILDPNKPSPEAMLYWSVQDDVGQPAATPEQ